MTSATGKPRRGGFTLIELMVVMAILLSLAAVLAFTLGPSILRRGREKATLSLLRRTILHLDRYKELHGHYPPDGIDTTIRNDQGEVVRGSAALYYFLSTPGKARRMVAGVPREVPHEAIGDYRESDLTPEDPGRPGVREIKDGFGIPIHYDNTENGKFRPQGGEIHMDPLDEYDHPPDVRTFAEDEGGVRKPGEVQSIGFDLWSHGSREHSTEGRPTAIGSWNLRGE